LTERDGSFKGLIDTHHIGVVGHSSGGYTALAAAGALSLAGLFAYEWVFVMAPQQIPNS